MAVNTSTAKRGNYLCKIGFLDIYQKIIYKGEGKNKQISSRDIAVYHAKKMLVNGFKTKEAAIEKASELMEKGISHINSLKNGIRR